jgi:hypothetical protein
MVFARSISRLARPTIARQLVTPPRASPQHVRTLTATARQQGKVLLVLYDVSTAPIEAAQLQIFHLRAKLTLMVWLRAVNTPFKSPNSWAPQRMNSVSASG